MNAKLSAVRLAAAIELGRETNEQTDVGNAERFVALHGDDVRYVGAWSKWLVNDGVRWALDDRGAVLAMAIDTARAMLAEAKARYVEAVEKYGEAEASGDAMAKAKVKAAKDAVTWAIRSQGAKALDAMLHVARADASIAIGVSQLDSDMWMLNVQNGTIDLRTGKLHPHRREDLITRLAPVAYDEAAQAPKWIAFLDRAMGGDADLVSYLQRVFGYALTGSIREHALGFFFGGGANGKSTALSTMHSLLGDYATPAPRGLLFRARGERHPTELASLHGRRFVTCAEIEAGASFDEALVKDLTGGDPVSVRRMREDFWSFTPTYKLFLAGNHKPNVRGDDDGIWRRMRLVPWTVTIPEHGRDKDLAEKLRDELPGILAWCVAGCRAWQETGLGEPAIVREATDGYRAESDAVGQFIDDELVIEKDANLTVKELRERYEAWCEESGLQPAGPKRVNERLRRAGAVEGPVRRGAKVKRGWLQVRFITDLERERRHVDMSRREIPISCDHARAREDANRKTASTDVYTSTGDELFDDWAKREVGRA